MDESTARLNIMRGIIMNTTPIILFYINALFCQQVPRLIDLDQECKTEETDMITDILPIGGECKIRGEYND